MGRCNGHQPVCKRSWILLFAVSFVLCFSFTECLKIAAFNIQVFGTSKAGKSDVMDVLVKIISRYDIVLIQEIRDSSGKAIKDLLAQTNENNVQNPFVMEISKRLGRTTSKEQYAFFYRPSLGLKVTQQYLFDDKTTNSLNEAVDIFEREPYIVVFESASTVMEKFAIAGIHVDPDEAVQEITALEKVFDNIKSKTKVENAMVMGDLNADCSYVPNKSWKDIPLKHHTEYTWLINDSEDTTVSKTDCAYDRFIVTGPGFSSAADGGLVPDSADVFRFDTVYGLTADEAKAVSDHYPIELELKDITSGSSVLLACVITLTIACFMSLLLIL